MWCLHGVYVVFRSCEVGKVKDKRGKKLKKVVEACKEGYNTN